MRVHLSKGEAEEVGVEGTGPWLLTFLLETCKRGEDMRRMETWYSHQGHVQCSGEPEGQEMTD